MRKSVNIMSSVSYTHLDVYKRQVLQPLLRQEDKLTGMHANTQIPKVIGFKRIADLEEMCIRDS